VAQKLLGALTTGGGSVQAEGGVEGVKGVKYAPKPPGMYENGKKQAVSALIDLKIAKNPVSYSPETFFEEFMKVKIFVT
jgi:hypothetical protein